MPSRRLSPVSHRTRSRMKKINYVYKKTVKKRIQRKKKSTKRRSVKNTLDTDGIFCNIDNLNMKNQKILDDILFKERDLSYVKKVGNKITIKNPNSAEDFEFMISSKQKLGSGTFSTVYKLFDEKQNVQLALKEETNEFPSEQEISEILSANHCGVINEVYFKTEDDTHYYFMSLAQGGTLEQLKKRTKNWTPTKKKQLFKSIVEKIRQQVICLYKNGYVYSDFKLSNILVDCDNGVKIFLGDLGSAIPNSDNNQVATYPPPDVTFNINEEGEIEKGIFKVLDSQKEGIITWGLGIILYSLMKSSSNCFEFSKTFDADKHRESMQEMDTFYGKGFGQYLNFHSNDRPSIDKAI